MAEFLNTLKRRRQMQSMSFPVELTCPYCGMAIDLWPGPAQGAQETAGAAGLETHCGFCGFQPYSHEKTLN